MCKVSTTKRLSQNTHNLFIAVTSCRSLSYAGLYVHPLGVRYPGMGGRAAIGQE